MENFFNTVLLEIYSVNFKIENMKIATNYKRALFKKVYKETNCKISAFLLYPLVLSYWPSSMHSVWLGITLDTSLPLLQTNQAPDIFLPKKILNLYLLPQLYHISCLLWYLSVAWLLVIFFFFKSIIKKNCKNNLLNIKSGHSNSLPQTLP